MVTITGGGNLEKVLTQLAAKVNKPATVSVGFLAKTTYPDGTPVAAIAAIQEFGAPSRGIPPRPFFRNMIAAKSGEWPAAVAGFLKANDYDATKALEQAGSAIEGQLRQSIYDTNSPPNKPSTVARKGASKVLVDTGHLLNSIEHEVK